MTRLLRLFVANSGKMNEYFHHRKVVEINGIQFLDDYVNAQFDVDLIGEREREYQKCRTFVFKPDDQVQVLAQDYMLPADNDEAPEKANWENYKFTGVALPESYIKANAEIRSFLENPLLPTQCVRLLERLLRESSASVSLIADILNDHRSQMLVQYATLEDVKRAHLSWLLREWSRRRPDIDATAKEVVVYARKSFSADEFDKTVQGSR
jgi:hypothetical protein